MLLRSLAGALMLFSKSLPALCQATPPPDMNIDVSKIYHITWNPSTGSPLSLALRAGDYKLITQPRNDSSQLQQWYFVNVTDPAVDPGNRVYLMSSVGKPSRAQYLTAHGKRDIALTGLVGTETDPEPSQGWKFHQRPFDSLLSWSNQAIAGEYVRVGQRGKVVISRPGDGEYWQFALEPVTF